MLPRNVLAALVASMAASDIAAMVGSASQSAPGVSDSEGNSAVGKPPDVQKLREATDLSSVNKGILSESEAANIFDGSSHERHLGETVQNNVESVDRALNIKILGEGDGNDEPTTALRGGLEDAEGSSKSTLVEMNTQRQWVQPPTKEEIEKEKEEKSRRMRERRERAAAAIRSVRPDPSTLTRLSQEEVEKVFSKENELKTGAKREGRFDRLKRALWGSSYEPYESSFIDPGQEYDMWAQAYRMHGGYIDCDTTRSEGDGSDEGSYNGCPRWMVWTAWVNPNYQGNGYYEYFGDSPTSSLDCHSPNTDWQLLGVYRQEFYQFIEQISKHLWAIDEYEYIVARAGLMYMTDDDCWDTGMTTSGGSTIYTGIQPLEGGNFQMSLYTDDECLFPQDKNLGMTLDDAGIYTSIQLESHSGDEGGDDDSYQQIYEIWEESQEYSLTNLNNVYDEYKYCTPCMDYPTYQDGYFIGDYGTDEDDLINQCWKFYSHDSFTCGSDCLSKAHAQGGLTAITYGGTTWGQAIKASTVTSEAKVNNSKMEKIKANVFVTFAAIVFVATFLAFAVARGSGARAARSSKARRLLDHDYGSKSGRSRRSKSRSKRDGERRSRSRRDGERKSRSKSARRSRSRGEYEPPSDSKRRSRSRRSEKEKSSRNILDDF